MSLQYCFLYRSSSPQMVRSIDGQGSFRTKNPPPSWGPTDLPSLLTTSGTTPKKGNPVDPGFAYTAPGSVVIMMAPVSVCHQVSTIGQRPPPTILWYQIQASGLIGSPTVPSRRRLDKSLFLGHSSPQRTNARMAVGAVYKIEILCRSIIRQKRPLSGKLGAPSYMKQVAPLES